MSEQEFHAAEQLQIQRQIKETLEKALHEPLTADDATLLAYFCGVTLTRHDKDMT